jgi:hypothetical protein
MSNCLICSKELGLIKYQSKKSWNIGSGFCCGKCFDVENMKHYDGPKFQSKLRKYGLIGMMIFGSMLVISLVIRLS